jgi:hypothetical protein
MTRPPSTLYDPTDVATWPDADLSAHLAWLNAPGIFTFAICWLCEAHPSRGGRICAACVRAEQDRRAASPRREPERGDER